jgi:hypothetical protein
MYKEIESMTHRLAHDNDLHMYSTKAIRFRFGYQKRDNEIESMTIVDRLY